MPYTDEAKNKEYQKAYQAAWRKLPENAQKLRDKARARQAAKPKEQRQAEWASYIGQDGNREAYNEKRRLGRDRPEEYIREIKRQYGLTAAQLAGMVERAGGRCEICGNTPEKALHVDHDHETGFVRGLLCMQCNTALGALRDRVELFERAIKYLARAGTLPKSPLDLPFLEETQIVAMFHSDHRRQTYPKTCPCGKTFTAFVRRGKYCNVKCRNRYNARNWNHNRKLALSPQ